MSDEAEWLQGPVPIQVPDGEYRAYAQKRRQEEAEYLEFATQPGYAEKLRASLASYADTAEFEPGDLLEWKPGMRNRRFPLDRVPAIVVRYLNEEEGRAQSAAEPLRADRDDIVLGIVDSDGIFNTFRFESRRFQLAR